MKWKSIKTLTDSPGPSLGQAGSVVECPSPVYSTRKNGRTVPLRSEGAIWARKDCPSTFTVDRSTPDMSIMVGARSMFNTGAWTSRRNTNISGKFFSAMHEKPSVCVCSDVAQLLKKCPLGWQNTLNCPLGLLKYDKLPSWQPKSMPKCPLGWQITLNCPLGWLKYDKLPSWEQKHALKCPSGSQNVR